MTRIGAMGVVFFLFSLNMYVYGEKAQEKCFNAIYKDGGGGGGDGDDDDEDGDDGNVDEWVLNSVFDAIEFTLSMARSVDDIANYL